MGEQWTLYSDQRPETAGIYEWRMPSKAVDGLVLRVLAHHRKRGAGRADVLSPVFDRWDGYRVLVPAGLEWRSAPSDAPELKPYDQIVTPELKAVSPCPFCDKEPTWRSTQRVGSSLVICPDPDRRNVWWLECCEWARTPHLSDPRVLMARRARLLEQEEAA